MTCTVAVAQGGSVISSPLHFSASFLSASTLTLAGLPYTPANESFLLLEEITIQGTVLTWPSKNFKYSYNSGTGVLTIAGAALTSTSTFRLHIAAMNLGYDQATNAHGIFETDPLDSKVALENLVNITAAIGAGTNYYPSTNGLNMSGYKELAVYFALAAGTTFTLEAQLDLALTDWADITRSGDELMTGTSGAANYIDCTGLLQFQNLNVAFIRIKSVTVGGASTAQYDVRRRAL